MNLQGSVQMQLPVLALALLLFHLWYDLHVQGKFVSNAKRKNNVILMLHAATWTLFCAIPLYLVGTITPQQLIFLFVSHTLMDWTKCHVLPKNKKWPFAADQLVHVLTLGACLWQW